MKQFVVSARKYRPARFSDVVGQAHISDTLKNALKRGQIAHAYLFCGPRGVGKTTCARILAKVLNCEQRTDDFEACGTCPSCKAFDDNASFNITELDAASNNSVEHIRALVEQVRFAPQQGKFKIYIIDEVHMLSQGAFNAFLKTLEEPPPYAIFILATTEKHKIIPTILSRCQIYDFRRITVSDMAAHLQRIAQAENLNAESEALHSIAQKADGALRDALSLFDRIVSATGGEQLTYADVVNQLNILDYDYYFRVTDALLSEDISETLNIFDEVMRRGFDPELFIEGLSDHFRNLLVCQDPQTHHLVEGGDSLKARYIGQAALTPKKILLSGLHILNDCDVNFRFAKHKRLHVEMALVKLLYANRLALTTTETASDQKKNLSLSKDNEPVHERTPGAVASGSPDEPPKPQPSMGGSATSGAISLPSLKLDLLEDEVDDEIKKAAAANQEITLSMLSTVWQNYLGRLTKMGYESLQASQLTLKEQDWIIEVPTEAAKSYLNQDLNTLRKLLAQDWGPLTINYKVEVNQTLAPANTSEPSKKITNKDKYHMMLNENPTVDQFVQAFDLKLDSET
jgi:DNA polymerase-3 subunit gamma/tau